MSSQQLTIPAGFGALPAQYQNLPATNELSQGVMSSYGLIGYKGKVWSIRYHGETTNLMREDGDGPKSFIEVVILKASPYVSKIWYEKGYVEGAAEAPDCFSTNGLVPDASAPKKQCASCAACPKNVFGSAPQKPGQPPSKGKACGDSKRYAVVPADDIENESLGGPMLLRVPAMSMAAGGDYADTMGKLGYPYHLVRTKIQFDPNESYPKFVFSGVRVLTADECKLATEMRDSIKTTRVLAEDAGGTIASAIEPTLATAFEQPPVTPAVTAATSSSVVPMVAAKPKVTGFGAVPAPKVPRPPVIQLSGPAVEADVEQEASKFEEDLDAQLDALLPK